MARKKTFETALKQLETIVKEMESGDLLLEEAVKKYELGIKQAKFCIDLLDKTEKKIRQLSIDENGELKESSYKNE